MNVETISENKHKELLKLLTPLVDFMNANGFNYFMLAGKDGTCAKYVKGDFDDLTGMLTSLMSSHPDQLEVVKHAVGLAENEAA